MDTFKLETGIEYNQDVNQLLGNTSKGNTNGTRGNLEYVKMLTKNKLTVRIACPNPKGGQPIIVKSGMGSDFSFSLGNEWVELAPLNGVPIIGDVGQNIASLAQATTGASQGSLEALWMTSASWKGCQLPKFSVSLSFLNYSRSASFMNNLYLLARGALPKGAYATVGSDGSVSSNAGDLTDIVNAVVGGIDKVNNFFADQLSKIGDEEGSESAFHNLAQDVANTLKNSKYYGTQAPLGYGLTSAKDDGYSMFTPLPGTTYALEVGNWFSAPSLLIESISPTFSKETVHSGNPLLMTINVVLRPHRKIAIEEFWKYFKLKG